MQEAFSSQAIQTFFDQNFHNTEEKQKMDTDRQTD